MADNILTLVGIGGGAAGAVGGAIKVLWGWIAKQFEAKDALLRDKDKELKEVRDELVKLVRELTGAVVTNTAGQTELRTAVDALVESRGRATPAPPPTRR